MSAALVGGGRARAAVRALACAVLMILVTPAIVAAQAGAGVAAIEGTITDPDNRPIAGALVIIVSSETGYDRTVYTDARGRYFASAMPVGTYLIDVSAPNFAASQQSGVRVGGGATATINFALKIGKGAETGTVEGAVPLLDKDETVSGCAVDSRAVS